MKYKPNGSVDRYKVATQRPHVTDQNAFARELFSQLPAGLSCVLLHPAIDTEEVRRATDQWKGRVADFETFRQPSLRDHIRQLGIQLISYTPLRDAMRSRLERG